VCNCSGKTAERHVEGFFRLCDKDSSGEVSFEEFLQEYTRMQMFKALRALQTKVSRCSIPRTVVFCCTIHAHSGACTLPAQFTESDLDGNGSLSKDELEGALAKAVGYSTAFPAEDHLIRIVICFAFACDRPRAAAEDIDQIFSEIDTDGSGEISMQARTQPDACDLGRGLSIDLCCMIGWMQELTAWHFNKSVMIKSDRQKKKIENVLGDGAGKGPIRSDL
jgi:Ca2+-binding EF-hand superfamily protein